MTTPRASMEHSIGDLLDGKLSNEAAKVWLESLDIRQLNAHQIAGAVDAVMARSVPFPAHPDAIDCCGTGGDGRLTYNISTAAAFIAAARGVVIAKHGNRAVTSQSGSADVLGALGINTILTPEHAARILDKVGITFLYAPTYHPGFARVAPIRKAIGKRTIFNLLGPLCNPARVKRQLIGVFAQEYCSVIAETCKLLGHTRAMVVHGEDGMDEISITGPTHVAQLMDGQISYSTLRPQDAELRPQEGRALIGGNADQNARALKDMLSGLESPYADAVLLNAAAILMLADRAPTLHEGVTLARSTIARGDAMRKLSELIEASYDDE